jgi:tetratricopeptide (TPR) repeat protein
MKLLQIIIKLLRLIRAYWITSSALLRQNRFDEVIIDLSKAIEIDAQNSISYVRRGEAYLLQRNYENSIFDFPKAIDINSEEVDAYIGRLMVYIEQKKYAEAVANFFPKS